MPCLQCLYVSYHSCYDLFVMDSVMIANKTPKRLDVYFIQTVLDLSASEFLRVLRSLLICVVVDSINQRKCKLS